MQCTKTSLKRDGIANEISIFITFIFSLLEPSEVILNQESGVEFANRNFIVNSWEQILN